ncbi:hypothetical protein [Pelagicoccus albus]|uniref:Uncharacterized protein n=1 Tax=Pelagicoccus albus TaxID=415222 RepID=A0A7X1B740_9BACT|nr:hypothetical protein [Pelagicoccus albus]MBC2606867.1 hypothetical protein [Pelagicoccus albus]
MKKHLEHVKPYTPEALAMVPLGRVKFLRTFLPWQILRFLAINLKMTRLILRSHR